jgi:ribonuclease Z
MKIYAYSKALYSTWFYLEPLRLLLDAGEGLNAALEGRLLGFRDIVISHSHTDHFTGLQNILVTRLREMEVAEQPILPLQIIFPEDSDTLWRYFDYLKLVTHRWDELLTLVPTRPGQHLPLQGVRGMYLSVLEADHHVYKQTALAFRVEKERWALKPEWEGKPQQDINRAIGKEGRAAVAERGFQPLIHYSADTRVLYHEINQGIPLMIHEATFIEPHPQTSHASLEEVVELFLAQQPQQLLLFHLSTRYEFKEFTDRLEALIPDAAMRERISIVRPGRFFAQDIPTPGL